MGLGVMIIKKIFEKLKKDITSIIAILLGLALYPLVHHLAGSCPIRQLLGISCPGCGILRAYVAAFELDLGKAFSCHPLWFAVPIILALIIIFYLTDKSKALHTTVVISVALFFAVYFIRLIFGDGSIVYINPKDSAVYEFFSNVFN